LKRQHLSHREISSLCSGLALLLHAGISLNDGLYLLAEEAAGAEKEHLTALGKAMDLGAQLSDAMADSGVFPPYVSGLVRVGEQTGHAEETLQALARYYQEREETDLQLRNALSYPAILMVLMAAVILVLLVKVLPVFDGVYASLGSRLTGLAGALLRVGEALGAVMPLLCVLLVVIAAAVLLGAVVPSIRENALALWRRGRGDKGLSARFNNARFAQAMAMALRSGMAPEEAADLAAQLLADVPQAAQRCRACAEAIAAGADLSDAMREAGLLPAASCRLLTVGIRSGSGDQVMEDIALQLSREASRALDTKVSRIEPAIVVLCSVLVGIILLAVMLPLLHILSAIG